MNINSIINDQLWKAVPGFPCYDCHPTGLIRNAITGNLVKPFETYGGGSKDYEYRNFQCHMRDANGNWKKPYVHRIVALTFIDIPAIEGEDNWQVDHIDFNTSNNDVRNLRWLPAKLNRILQRRTRPEVVRQTILDYYKDHDIDYDMLNLLSEI